MGNIYIGIDPGVKGGMAYIGIPSAAPFLQPLATLSKLGIYHYLEYLRGQGVVKVVLEKVSGYIAGSEAPAARMFTLGESYGSLLMALSVLELPFKEVTPQVWQKAVGIRPRKKLGKKSIETSSQYKEHLKGTAQILYPHLADDITLQTADSLLIARYCMGGYE